jgi:hypothetical protein
VQALPRDGLEHVVVLRGRTYRVLVAMSGLDPPAVLIPLDQLFDIRAAAAIALWRILVDRAAGADPSALTTSRRRRLILGLRALDGKRAGAGYREIATVLFGADTMPKRGWKTHDLRGRTIRLVRFGTEMMEGGYRQLLLHPYRRRK